MTRALSLAAVLVLASFHSGIAFAQGLPDTVKVDMPVAVVDEAGTVTQGRVEGVSDAVIRIKRRGRVEEVPLTKIVRIEKTDSLKNGALTGLALGAGMGLIGAISVTGSYERSSGFVYAMALGNAVIYGALGTAIDAMIPGKRTLYERGRTRETRIAPIVGPKVAGAAVRVTW